MSVMAMGTVARRTADHRLVAVVGVLVTLRVMGGRAVAEDDLASRRPLTDWHT